MTALSNMDVRRLSTLGEIVRFCDADGAPVSHATLLEASPEGTDRRQLREEVDALADLGYVDLDERFNGAWLARPTSSGRQAWAELKALRNSIRDRRGQMRDDYLLWVYNQHEEGLSPVADAFLESGALFLGMPFTQEDLERTGEWLLDHGFVKGPKVWQRPDAIRPTITAKGQLYVEEGRSVHDPATSVGSSTTFQTTVNGPAVLAQNSQHVQQTQILNGWQNDARGLADALDQLVSLIVDERNRAEVAASASDLRAEVDGAARPERVREITDGITKALGTGAGGALGTALIQQAFALLGSLPL